MHTGQRSRLSRAPARLQYILPLSYRANRIWCVFICPWNREIFRLTCRKSKNEKSLVSERCSNDEATTSYGTREYWRFSYGLKIGGCLKFHRKWKSRKINVWTLWSLLINLLLQSNSTSSSTNQPDAIAHTLYDRNHYGYCVILTGTWTTCEEHRRRCKSDAINWIS